MKRSINITIILLSLMIPGVMVAKEEVTDNADLIAAIEVYRSEGPASALPELARLQLEYNLASDWANEATALRYIGECHWHLGNLDESRDHLDRALFITRELADTYAEGKVLNVLGLLEWDLGNFDAAIEVLGQARVIAEESAHELLLAGTLNNLSLVYDELGDYQTSLKQYEHAYELFTKADDLRGQSNTLGNIGGVHLILGRFALALEYYQRALAISRQMQSSPSMTIDHGNIALCYLGLGQVDLALYEFDQALELAVKTGLKQEEAYWQRGKANALIRKGEYNLGLQNHRSALAIYEETGTRGLLLDALHDMGRLYLELGDPVSAEIYFQRAIELARDIGRQQAITVNLLALGDLQFERMRLEEAKALYSRALKRAGEVGELYQQAQSQLRLSMVGREQHQYAEAKVYSEKALAIARDIGASMLEAEVWFNLAESEREQLNTASAFTAYESAQTAAGENPDPELTWQIHYGRARAHVQNGEKEDAMVQLQSAARIIESVRDRLSEERFRSGYVQDKFQVYIELVRLQLELGKIEDAFSTAERLRARSFLAQLDMGDSVARSENERQTEMALRERIRLLQTSLSEEQERLQPERRQMALDAFSSELVLAERDYQAFLDDISDSTPALKAIKIPSLKEMQEMLDSDEALVEFVVGKNVVMVFVLRKDRLYASSSDLRRSDLVTKVKLVRELVQRPQSDRWVKPAASLYDSLIEPLVGDGLLSDIEHIYFVPHGILNYLPFALLPATASGKRLVIDSFTLSYLPSATALVQNFEHVINAGALLALAPEKAHLRFAREEARSVSAIFDSATHLLEGKQATESAFKEQAKNYGMLHFATHGYFNRKNPLFSGLELEADESNDGLLQVYEILRLSLDARLVTLSACQTGLGTGYFNEIPAGDDFVSLTRAFLLAGSDAVLASLWEVDDRSTVELMSRFYQRLRASGSDAGKATALALAQREMRLSGEFNHPFYWAPFVLVGQHDPVTSLIDPRGESHEHSPHTTDPGTYSSAWMSVGDQHRVRSESKGRFGRSR